MHTTYVYYIQYKMFMMHTKFGAIIREKVSLWHNVLVFEGVGPSAFSAHHILGNI